MRELNKEANKMLRDIIKEENATLKTVAHDLKISYNSLCQRFHHGSISFGLAKQIIENLGYKIALWKND